MKRPPWSALVVPAVFLGFVAAIAVCEPAFVRLDNIRNIGQHMALNAVIAAGMTLVILTGGIDLSVGSIVAFAGLVTAMMVKAGVPVALGIPLGIAAGGAVGAVNGVLIAVAKLPPFIVTLAMMVMARSVTRVLSGNLSIYDLPAGFDFIGGFVDVLGARVPVAVLIVAATYVGLLILLRRYPLGRAIYAIGGNEEAARLSGIAVARVKICVYAICGALAGLSGIIAASRIGAADPKQGQLFELNAIAAVVVGGTSLMGGRGGVLGTLLGALIVACLDNALSILHVEPNWQGLVQGLVIVGAVLATKLRRGASAGRKEPQ